MSMPKPMRIVLFALGGLVVLLVVGVLIAILTVDPAKLASTVSKRVLQDTGRELHIDGDVSVSFFPWLGVTMTDARLTNPEGFGGGSFFTAGNIEFRAKLLPLLQNKFIVDTVVLDGLVLNLVHDEQGLANWDFLQRSPSEAGASVPAEPAAEQPPAAFLDIAAVEISDATVSYVNLATNSSVATDDVQLSLAKIRVQDDSLGTDFSLSGAVHSTKPALEGSYKTTASVVFDQSNNKVMLRNFAFEFQGTGDALPGSKADVSLKGDLSLDTNTHGAVIDNATFKAYGATINGNLRVMDPVHEGGLVGNLALAECNPRSVLAALGISMPDMQDSTAFTRLSAHWRVESSFSDLSIPTLDIRLDDTQITGSIEAEKAKESPAAPPSLSGRLQIDALDIDRYMPASSQKDSAGPSETSQSAQKGGGKTLPADPETLPDVDLVVSMGTLKASGAKMSNVTMNMKGGRGQYRVDPIRASLYGGSLDADASFDLTGQVPASKLTASLASINLGALLTDVTGKASMRGTARTAFTISAAGMEGTQILKTLNGSGTFYVANGDFPLASDLPAQLDIEQKGAREEVKSATSQTSFSELKGSFSIKNGVVSNNDMFLAMRMADVSGRGDVDLPARQIDYLATMDLLSASVLPIRIRGPLSDPSIFVDPVELVRLSAQGVQTLITAPMDAVQAIANGTIPGSETLGGVGEAGKKMLEGILGGQKSGGQQQSQDGGKSIEEGIGNALDSIFGGSKK